MFSAGDRHFPLGTSHFLLDTLYSLLAPGGDSMKLAIILLLLAAITIPACASSPDADALLQLERNWAASLARGETAFLESVTSPDWTNTGETGMRTKAQVLAAIRSGKAKLASVELSDLNARLRRCRRGHRHLRRARHRRRNAFPRPRPVHRHVRAARRQMAVRRHPHQRDDRRLAGHRQTGAVTEHRRYSALCRSVRSMRRSGTSQMSATST